jgi:hypothetical protein
LTPECAFSAGALIASCAVQLGVELRSDGTVAAIDLPGTAEALAPWVNLVDRIFTAILLGSEAGVSGAPDSWIGQQARIAGLLRTCPDWLPTRFGLIMRTRAAARRGAGLWWVSTGRARSDS